MNSSLMSSLLWFVAILALIPAALWLLKRTPAGGAGGGTLMKHVAVLPLSASQRLVTVEVGSGDERRWLVLGATAQSSEAAVNSSTPAMKIRRRPWRSPSEPPSRISEARVSR